MIEFTYNTMKELFYRLRRVNMATLKEVAEFANVSIATVSRILNDDNSLTVLPETKEKVIKAAEQLNYIPKSKRKGNHDEALTVAVIQWYSFEQEMRDTYYLSLIQGVENYLKTNGIIAKRIRKDDMDLNKVLENVQGIICIGKFEFEVVKELKEYTENIVLLDMDISPVTECCVTLDFDNAMFQVVDYFNRLGHKHIGFLGRGEYEELSLHISTRKSSFIKYCQYFGLKYTELLLENELTSEAGYNLIHNLAKTEELPTAIFAVNDPIAIGAMRALQDQGIRVPEQVSIIGFNNIEAGNFTTPSLTTVYAPSKEMGNLGAMLLHEMMLKKKALFPMRVQLPCSLLERKSCKKII